MALAEKRSRNIRADGNGYCWRTSGNDNFIYAIAWPVEYEAARIVGFIGHRGAMVGRDDGTKIAIDQVTATGRLFAQFTRRSGVEKLRLHNGQIGIDDIEDIVELNAIENTTRGQSDNGGRTS